MSAGVKFVARLKERNTPHGEIWIAERSLPRMDAVCFGVRCRRLLGIRRIVVSKFLKEFVLLVEWPANCHVATIDNETKVEHKMRDLGIPFVVL